MSDTNDDLRAYLGMPSYVGCTGGASRAFWNASRRIVHLGGRDRTLRVDHDYRQGSLLAATFNTLWCAALNRCASGEGVDYFAMLHADCEPLDGWLDVLIEELESRRFDMLGVAAPIKDSRGLTSIALARPDNDTWRPLCRLSMREIYQLPPTFTADDAGYPLLLNTGCWVCKFDPAWASQVFFTVNDRIAYDANKKIYFQVHEPEDWFFSRALNDLGLKIGVTRKVQLIHAGENRWHNCAPWGQAFDSEYVPESLIPDRDNGFKFPFDVDGWLLPEEGEALAELARGKIVLEIGSYCGKSTICLAQTARSVTSIDPHDGRGTPNPRNTYGEFYANLKRYGLCEKVADFPEMHPDWGRDYDLAFIDGAHDYESVAEDVERSLCHLKPGGLLAFHDYRRCAGAFDGRWDPGVNRAVDELLARGGELLSTHATLAVVKPPAEILVEV